MTTVVVIMSLDPDRGEDVLAHFHRDVVPFATSRPGFVSGRWLRSVDGRCGFGLMDFETEEQADAAAAGPRGSGREEGRAWNIDSVHLVDQVAQA